MRLLKSRCAASGMQGERRDAQLATRRDVHSEKGTFQAGTL